MMDIWWYLLYRLKVFVYRIKDVDFHDDETEYDANASSIDFITNSFFL